MARPTPCQALGWRGQWKQKQMCEWAWDFGKFAEMKSQTRLMELMWSWWYNVSTDFIQRQWGVSIKLLHSVVAQVRWGVVWKIESRMAKVFCSMRSSFVQIMSWMVVAEVCWALLWKLISYDYMTLWYTQVTTHCFIDHQCGGLPLHCGGLSG